jgi:hypothetical protein
VVPVYDVEESEGELFIAMELMEGSLSQWLDPSRSAEEGDEKAKTLANEIRERLSTTKPL